MAEMTEAYDWRGRTALVEIGFFGTRSLFVPIAKASCSATTGR